MYHSSICPNCILFKYVLFVSLYFLVKTFSRWISFYNLISVMRNTFYLHSMKYSVLHILYSPKPTTTTCLRINKRIAERMGSCHNLISNFCTARESFPAGILHPLNFFPWLYGYCCVYFLSDNLCISVELRI